MTSIAVFVYAVLVYGAIGVIVGAFALLTRAAHLDARLAHAPLRVKLVLVPGSAVLWPMVLVRAFA
ncbi:MAG: hypothetical protein AAFY46_04840, partial [Planctomycetota bacterium]